MYSEGADISLEKKARTVTRWINHYLKSWKSALTKRGFGATVERIEEKSAAFDRLTAFLEASQNPIQQYVLNRCFFGFPQLSRGVPSFSSLAAAARPYDQIPFIAGDIDGLHISLDSAGVSGVRGRGANRGQAYIRSNLQDVCTHRTFWAKFLGMVVHHPRQMRFDAAANEPFKLSDFAPQSVIAAISTIAVHTTEAQTDKPPSDMGEGDAPSSTMETEMEG